MSTNLGSFQGLLTTSVLAHGNNMQGMNCMNGQMMEQGMKMHNNMNQKNMMHGNMKDIKI